MACAPSGPERPVVSERLHLADVSESAGRARHETVDGVSRVVLVAPHTSPLQPQRDFAVETGADGAVLSVGCPPALRGRPAAVLAVANPRDLEVKLVQCPADGSRVVVRVAGLNERAGPATVVVHGLESDAPEVRAVTLPDGARLQLHLGLRSLTDFVEGAPGEGRPGRGRFRIVAGDAMGRTVTVLDRVLDPAAEPGWMPVDVDLAPVRRTLGADVRLSFSASDEGGGQPIIPLWGDPTLVWPRPASAPASPPRRNVVLVSIDTLRADRLGSYGAHRPTSPVLDALAEDGTRFETVIAPAPWTLPSHATMMTGLYACAHGISRFALGQQLPERVVPLAERLRKSGYATAAVTENGWVDAATFRRGFGVYTQTHGGDDRVRHTVALAARWLRTEATKPFFLFVHTYQPHDSLAPPPFAGMFDTYSGITGPAPLLGAGPVEQALARYDAAIRFTDDSLAPLLAAVAEVSPRRETLVVVTSDHGEAFGEHGFTGHGGSLDEEVLRVPLMWWGPGLVARGRSVAGLAGVIDVAPTILDLLGLPVPAEMQGRSLVPQLRRRRPAPLPADRVLFSENSRARYRVAARSLRWKAHFEDGGIRLFDLLRDPMERAPTARPPEVMVQAATLRTTFAQECAARRTEPAVPAAPAVVDPDQERRLKALGYVLP